MRNLNIHGMIITIKNIMRNLNIHGMIITILDQQFNQVSVPIVIVTILLNSLSPGNADVFPVVSANPPSAPYFSVACFRRSNYGVWREFREEGEIGREGEGDMKEPWLFFLLTSFAQSPRSERRWQSTVFGTFQAERSILYSFLQILRLSWSTRKRTFFIVLNQQESSYVYFNELALIDKSENCQNVWKKVTHCTCTSL